MKFDYTCDARVSTTIEADSREEADEKWKAFCADVDNSDHLCTHGARHLYVSLCDMEDGPEVEEVPDD